MAALVLLVDGWNLPVSRYGAVPTLQHNYQRRLLGYEMWRTEGHERPETRRGIYAGPPIRPADDIGLVVGMKSGMCFETKSNTDHSLEFCTISAMFRDIDGKSSIRNEASWTECKLRRPTKILKHLPSSLKHFELFLLLPKSSCMMLSNDCQNTMDRKRD